MSRIFYKNDNDVHLYTRECAEFAAGLEKISDPISDAHLRSIITSIQQKHGTKYDPLLRKMLSRTIDHGNSLTYYDSDTHTNIWRLLSIAVFQLQDVLEETLEEMGQHCVQGDSHRLISIIATLIDPPAR